MKQMTERIRELKAENEVLQTRVYYTESFVKIMPTHWHFKNIFLN